MSDILSISEIKHLLQDRIVTVVQEKTGLSYGTIDSLKKGEERNYNVGTLKIISDYLNGK